MKKTFRLENLDCANCAAKIERSVQKVEGVNSVNVNFMTAKMNLELVDENSDSVIEEIKKTVKSFIGDIEQIPPMFSAIKINGEKLYNLARKGIEVERKKRKVKIYYIHNIEYDKKALKMSFIVGVSSGTYIRSLVCDIGEKLGVQNLAKLITKRFGVETKFFDVSCDI